VRHRRRRRLSLTVLRPERLAAVTAAGRCRHRPVYQRCGVRTPSAEQSSAKRRDSSRPLPLAKSVFYSVQLLVVSTTRLLCILTPNQHLHSLHDDVGNPSWSIFRAIAATSLAAASTTSTRPKPARDSPRPTDQSLAPPLRTCIGTLVVVAQPTAPVSSSLVRSPTPNVQYE
jgi:hypothetical protein